MSYYRELQQRISLAMQRDQHRLRNALRAIQTAEERSQPFDDRLAKFLDQLALSELKREERAAIRPKLEYDPALPITAAKDEIIAAIEQHPVVVVCGETGSGKSTQLPKFCLEMGRGIRGWIGHTQPRRIAARSIATRLTEELGSQGSKQVGYKVRFHDSTDDRTLVKVMTDGVLLAETQTDRFLDQYDTLIIDEAHERSLNIDFLLGYLHRLLYKRSDLRLIITSATIDAERIAAHFSQTGSAAPIIQVSGRSYPVEIRHEPPAEEQLEGADLITAVADATEQMLRTTRGDLLVFLPTERDIRAAHQVLRGRAGTRGNIEILPLYARLSLADQQKVFKTHSQRRIVLATNVAESSVTVPAITGVIDTGTARISRYSPRSKVQRLPIEPISQASANQRAGRCGRIAPGVCIRLYSEEDFQSREPFTSPEIQRTNLAAVLLQSLALDLGPLEEFPLLDVPRAEAIRDGFKTLFELRATDDKRQLTPLGKRLARLPVDPSIARMLLAANEEHCLADVLIIAAALEVQDPRDRPADQAQQATAAHLQWSDPDSDFLSWLHLWDFIHSLKEKLSRNQLKHAFARNFLSEPRVREWQDVHRQLLEMAAEQGLHVGKRISPQIPAPNEAEEDPEASSPATRAPKHLRPKNDVARDDSQAYQSIHRALLTGLLTSIARKTDTTEYQACGGQKYFLWPGSGVQQSRPAWIVAAELVETSRRFARGVARIQPTWLEELAGHLIHRNFSDYRWSEKRGQAMASERLILAGLTLAADRPVPLAPIDAAAARELMISQGLVEGRLPRKPALLRDNEKILDDIAKLAAKTRRRDLVIDPQKLVDFYESRLPRDIVDLAGLDRWWNKATNIERKTLLVTLDDLLDDEIDRDVKTKYPDKLDLPGASLNLAYHFEPGSDADGVTVEVPAAAAAQLSPDRLAWLVPGLLAEKIEALIRSLPKEFRRKVIPAPQVAREISTSIRFAEGRLLQVLAAKLSTITGDRIEPAMFDLARLPPHLAMNIRVRDSEGKVIAATREWTEVKAVAAPIEKAAAPAANSRWSQSQLKSWTFGELPREVTTTAGGVKLARYPALVDEGESVALTLVDWPDEAERLSQRGVRRLFAIEQNREIRGHVSWLPQLPQLRLWSTPLCKTTTLEKQLHDLLASRALAMGYPDLPRSADSYKLHASMATKHLPSAAQDVAKLLPPLLEAYHQARLAIEQFKLSSASAAHADVKEQLATLTSEGFLANTPWTALVHFPRYFRGISSRLKKLLAGGLARDKQNAVGVERLWKAWNERVKLEREQGKSTAELEAYRWQIEELRVSLFAQELGTSQSVSLQRLDKNWTAITSAL